MRFKGKVVLITGGASGIGVSTADCFLDEGASVAIVSRSSTTEQACTKLKKTHPEGRVMPFTADMSDEGDVARVIRGIIARFGRIDILVNAAGISEPGKIEDITLERWDYIIRNNLTNCFLCCKHVLPHMKRQRYGKIINVSSIAGRFRSNFAGIHYTASKAAIIALTKQLAAEAGPYRVNVNVLCPSQTDTDMLKKFLTPESRKKLSDSIPLRYIAKPRQQARVILFLASDDADYMNGSIVDVNGGQL